MKKKKKNSFLDIDEDLVWHSDILYLSNNNLNQELSDESYESIKRKNVVKELPDEIYKQLF